ncbi:UDP-N-acetylmuramate--L-alanine ligase [Planctomycetota bacterium]
MGKPGIKTYDSRIKAVHRYEVVDSGIAKIAGMRFHLIGAGGVGMSGLGQLIIKNSGKVSGSDQTAGSAVDELCKARADIRIGHKAENVSPQTDAVIISAAIKESNPELQAARKKGMPVYKYAQMLGILCNRYEPIAISGTHGKSTTGGWLVYCLKQLGIDTNFIIGAQINQLGASSGTGESEYFVVEACEYDRSFLNLRPRIGCILNIEQDHLDYYKNEDEIIEAFDNFAGGVKAGGVLIANGYDANTTRVVRDYRLRQSEKAGGNYKTVRTVTFGFSPGCNYRAGKIKLKSGLYEFEVCLNGKALGTTHISLPGRHNILNALAVVAMGVEAGAQAEQILEALPGFTGMDRRFMYKGSVKEIIVLDDYAHHPTEIKATLKAVRQRYRPRRLWCVFQPHQYSRTRFLLDDFAESFKLADITIVPEIYFVRDTESVKRQVNAEKLVERIRSKGLEAVFIDEFEGICEYLKDKVIPGDLVVTMGAGDIWKVADGFIQWLRENS